jgi:release factor glutamine methyltransferase
LKTLPIRVIAHDPLVALDGGLDGLDFYRRILSDATSYLEDKGFILFEMGFQQGKSIAEIAHGQLPNGTVEILRDINQKERFVKITI